MIIRYIMHFSCLFGLLAVLIPHASAQLIIDTFQYQQDEAAAKVWRPVAGTPGVRVVADGGLHFPIPFKSDIDRVYWDREGVWDFSNSTSVKIDLSCDHPAALRSLAIYFRSGKGWYVWNKPLAAAGRQILVLPKRDFQSEGQPDGWSNIDKIRISPWKGQAMDTQLTLHSISTRKETIFLIQATDSAPNAVERSIARRTTERLGKWLMQSGIPHAIVTEDQLETVAGKASLLVFPYNPKISSSGITALSDFANRGGKMLVFYSSDDRLARLMQVQLGIYTNTRDIARWRGMEFNRHAPDGLPLRLHQLSWSVGLVTPTSKDGKVIAWWVDAAGKKSDDPAVIATSRGYWFTHILLDDDILAKQRTLAAVMASLDATLWKEMSDHALHNAGRIDGWSDAADAVRKLNDLSENHPNGETIKAFTRRIGIQHRQFVELHRKGKYQEAVKISYQLTDLLIKTYGLAQTAKEGEFRGVWDHDGTGWYPGDWDRTAKMMAESGITAIFINASWAGLAHYPSKVLPPSFTYRFYGDQLQQCIKAARKYGLEVHAWIICWYLENSPAEFTGPLRKGDRLQHTSKGVERLWMNPAHPANVRHHLDIISEILTNYNVDGIHLDYIRYPDRDGCFAPYSRQRFESDTGREVANWPQDVLAGGINHENYVSWRAGIITDFVRQARRVTNKLNPTARLSAAVWGGYPQIIPSIGQDWALWMRDGILDFICPMNYANDLYRFTSLIDQQLTLPGVRGKLYPGIGVTANESQLRGDQVIEQILATRNRGVNGFVLFDLSQTLVDDTLPALRMGITKP